MNRTQFCEAEIMSFNLEGPLFTGSLGSFHGENIPPSVQAS